MDSKKLIDLIKLKDKYAIALMDYYIDKGVNTKDLQRYIDSICDEWARTFIATYHNNLTEKEVQIAIFRYLDGIGAKQSHSGKRFSEALYRQMHNYVNNQNSELSK